MHPAGIPQLSSDTLSTMLQQYADIFSSSKLDYGQCSVRPFEIEVPPARNRFSWHHTVWTRSYPNKPTPSWTPTSLRSSYNTPLDTLCGGSVFSVFHVFSGFTQLTIHPDTIPLTAFCTPNGLHEWLRMPQSVASAPAWSFPSCVWSLPIWITFACTLMTPLASTTHQSIM